MGKVSTSRAPWGPECGYFLAAGVREAGAYNLGVLPLIWPDPEQTLLGDAGDQQAIA